MAAGQKLKFLRNSRNITVRGVEEASRRLADLLGDKRYLVSNGWLVQLENDVSSPNIFKLFTLSVIYETSVHDLLRFYGIDVDQKQSYESVANPQHTQLIAESGIPDWQIGTSEATRLVPEIKNITPAAKRARKSSLTGYIGLSDMTMYPLIRPGSLVEIDTSNNKVQARKWNNEFERPIYFIELRDGYACGWCQLEGKQLSVVPHPLSPASVRHFAYPRDAEIVGRVISYQTRCVDDELARDAKRD